MGAQFSHTICWETISSHLIALAPLANTVGVGLPLGSLSCPIGLLVYPKPCLTDSISVGFKETGEAWEMAEVHCPRESVCPSSLPGQGQLAASAHGSVQLGLPLVPTVLGPLPRRLQQRTFRARVETK